VYQIGANTLINVTDLRSDGNNESFFEAHVGVGIVLNRVTKVKGPDFVDGEVRRPKENIIVPGLNLIASANFLVDSTVSPVLQLRTTVDSDIPSSATSFFALSFGLLVGP